MIKVSRSRALWNDLRCSVVRIFYVECLFLHEDQISFFLLISWWSLGEVWSFQVNSSCSQFDGCCWDLSHNRPQKTFMDFAHHTFCVSSNCDRDADYVDSEYNNSRASTSIIRQIVTKSLITIFHCLRRIVIHRIIVSSFPDRTPHRHSGLR